MNSTSNTLQQLVLRETDDGLKLVRFLVDVMDAEIEGVKTTDRTAAARELLDRCFGKPFTADDRTVEVSDDRDDASDVLLDRIMMVIDEVSSPDEDSWDPEVLDALGDGLVDDWGSDND